LNAASAGNTIIEEQVWDERSRHGRGQVAGEDRPRSEKLYTQPLNWITIINRDPNIYIYPPLKWIATMGCDPNIYIKTPGYFHMTPSSLVLGSTFLSFPSPATASPALSTDDGVQIAIPLSIIDHVSHRCGAVSRLPRSLPPSYFFSLPLQAKERKAPMGTSGGTN
jgi:hypothetical protein